MSFSPIGIVSCALLMLSAGTAKADQLRATYDISLAGITLGQASVAADVDSSRYKLDLNAKLTGLASAIATGHGAGSASGSLTGGRLNSSGYAITAKTREGLRTVRMSMASGTVQKAEIVPPLEPKPDRVAVEDAHKKGVIDPVSAFLMPVNGANPLDPAACNRRIPIYDGASRFDIVLSYKATQMIESKGYSGPALVCSARYVPIAGHREGRKATVFMAENRDMEAWLAPVGNQKLLAPVKVSVRTMIGTTVLQASRFEVQGTTASIKR
jgi:hypothetical protein